MSATPLSDVQIAISKAVEKAQALPPDSVGDPFASLLVGVYVPQFVNAIAAARKSCDERGSDA